MLKRFGISKLLSCYEYPRKPLYVGFYLFKPIEIKTKQLQSTTHAKARDMRLGASVAVLGDTESMRL